MTPEQFIQTWHKNTLNEEAGAQGHFEDLCSMLGIPKPRDKGQYCYERKGALAEGRTGYADVWKDRHFGWENKAPGENLNKALDQLKRYASALHNPPLLVVCDRERIEIHTNFQNYPTEVHRIGLLDIGTPENLQKLKWVFTDPDKLKPLKSSAAITESAAAKFGAIAHGIRQRQVDGHKVAHFLVQCVFCMFAEDENLLPSGAFTNLLSKVTQDPERAASRLGALFQTMQSGGDYGDIPVEWFNGGLFKHIDIPQLTQDDLQKLHGAAAEYDWRAIDPTIFGTLFENGLESDERSQLGANYTDTETIQKIITPLINEPLLAEWAQVKAQIIGHKKTTKSKGKKASQEVKAIYEAFQLRLSRFRVLDPACGSGNFLYLALIALRDVERLVSIEAQELGLAPELVMQTGPHNILGIEINAFAAELARVTVWIGDIQWCQRNGEPLSSRPILKPLDSIEHRDALLTPEGQEAEWPQADVIVGNPPFLGGSKKRGELGSDYFDALAKAYPKDRVPPGADLVCYWFDKARIAITNGRLKCAGLVATNSIRGGANRTVLDAIARDTPIFTAWSDEPWVNAGAAVRVSLICFGQSTQAPLLNGNLVGRIHPDLTAGENGNADNDLTLAKVLSSSQGTCFMGSSKKGPFDIDGDMAREWLLEPNPNCKTNALVVRPLCNGLDITRRWGDRWVVDFGTSIPLSEAAMFEAPFTYINAHVRPLREKNNRDSYRKFWWRHAEARPGMRKALSTACRYIVTVAVAKHRTFIWMSATVLPDQATLAIAREDDSTFGILHSRLHELWSLRMCTFLGVGNDPRYTPTTCFETFPFPDKLTPADTAHQQTESVDGVIIPAQLTDTATHKTRSIAVNIAKSAAHLVKTRDNWLNPPDWVEWVQSPEEAVAGFPKRAVAKPGHDAELKKRTLTNLYNARPAWLAMAHEAIDNAVAAAYGWTDYTPAMSDDEILKRLLALNLSRTSSNGTAAAPNDKDQDDATEH
jgi:type II restriction/modification system DNA methylase subunit YeeA